VYATGSKIGNCVLFSADEVVPHPVIRRVPYLVLSSLALHMFHLVFADSLTLHLFAAIETDREMGA